MSQMNLPILKLFPGETKEHLAKRQKRYEKKMAEYAKFLIEDEDWDFAFIFHSLIYKLERTRDCIVKNKLIVRSDDVGKEINEVVVLLKKVVEDDYEAEFFKDYYKKYGKPKMVSKPVEGKEGKLFQIEFLYKGKPATEAMRKEMRKLYKQAGAAKVADLHRAFKLMEDRIWGWWD